MGEAHPRFRLPPGRAGLDRTTAGQAAPGTIRGRVTDRASEQPLPGALGSARLGPPTLSDRDGRQVLVRADAGAQTVDVSTFGYGEQMRTAKGCLTTEGSEVAETDANTRIHRQAAEDPVLRGMGTRTKA
jgi:hypothetical protein